MTEYLDHCELSVTTPLAPHRLALRYILEEFRVNMGAQQLFNRDGISLSGEDVMKKMFEKCPVKMRMYGSPQEMEENIKIYKDFPGSHRYFNDDLEMYFTTPIIYDSLKNEKFICKSDLFVVLQSMVVRAFGKDLCPLPVTVCAFLLKSNEERAGVGFVAFDKEALDEIWKEIQSFSNEMKSLMQVKELRKLRMQESKPSSHQERFGRFKSYIPNNWNKSQSYMLENTLSQFVDSSKSKSSKSVSDVIADWFSSSKVLSGILQKIIKKRPEMFLPNSEKGPVTVRLFEDGDNKSVMKAELFNALKLPSNHQKGFYIETIPFEKVLREFKVENFEFIRYPIQRTKHRAVPIPGVHLDEPKNFCILAVDGFFEQMRSLIFGQKFFQKFQRTDREQYQFFFENHTEEHFQEYLRTDWTAPQIMFDELEEIFQSDYKTPYFLRTAALEAVELTCKTQLARFEWIPTKTIRNARPDGFTVQNLKAELVYLRLTVTFPEILDHAEVVYAHVDKVKKAKFLRTCDLMDALEYCQLICFFERHPNYKTFLHNQGGCGRVPGLNCDFCVKIKSSEPEIPSETHTKESEQLKIKISSLEAENSQLKQEGSSEISKLRNELKTEQEKSKKIEDDLVKKAKEILEIEVGNIKLNAENEANKKVKEQLLEKLSKLSVDSDH